MARPPSVRSVGELTSPEVSQCLQATSILCLPIGAIEQHGAHLPLDTDVVVAEELTRRIVARWGDELDLWQLPTFPIGLSREHDWAPGDALLSIHNFVSLLRDLARNIVRALPARNLAIVNGHGGNRGVLDNLIHELRGDFALNACVIHPFDLAKVDVNATVPDVHGGRSETSVMLALAPQRVRRDAIAPPTYPPDGDALAALVFDRGASFPWRTDDPRLTASGAIGEAHAASRELGEAIIGSVVEEARGVLRRLLENQTPDDLSVRPSFVTGENSRHDAGKRGENAPVGVAEICRHPDCEEGHDIDDRGGRDAHGERPRGHRSRSPGEGTDHRGKDQPKAGPKQQGRLQHVVERYQRREVTTMPIARGGIEPVPNRQNEISNGRGTAT